jgi:hypothetical protein
MGRLCYPTQHPASPERSEGSWYSPTGEPYNCPGARKVRRSFCHHGTSFVEFWSDRGTIWLGAENLSPVTKLVRSTGAVSRYKLSRCQKTVKVNCILITSRCACPGAKTITKLSWGQELSKNRDKPIKHTVRVSSRLDWI